MLRHNPKDFAFLQRTLSEIHDGFDAVERANPLARIFTKRRIAADARKKLEDYYSSLAELLRLQALLSTADKAARIVAILREDCDWRDYGIAAKELWQRLEDEMSHRLILQVEPTRVEFYDNPQPFGREVCEAFPSAIVDLQEACSCYSLGRNVACVMHLQRALEFALKLLCRKIGVTEFLPSWHAMLKKIDAELGKPHGEMHEFVREHLQQTAEAAALLREVQLAWRNPSMHVDAIYDDYKALEVLNAARAFLRTLSGLISEN